ncbi:MAG: iron-containing alcohol dehydrogenase [Thermoplasmata archaeon]|nr:iron-containing alcohol dehydrogenase [Thermoplasmata archaeon]
MQCIIFNSGIGKRMGSMTADRPKCMVKLPYGESILERQLRIISSYGIRDFIITTGPYEEKIRDLADSFPDLNIKLISNPKYDSTNNIYSFYLLKDHIVDDDYIILHGDLVFDSMLVSRMVSSESCSSVAVDTSAPLPPKDFKGGYKDGKISRISVNINENCVTLQPFYRVTYSLFTEWMQEVIRMVDAESITDCYAEEAFNRIDRTMTPVDCAGTFIMEIDNPEDYDKAKSILDKEGNQTFLEDVDGIVSFLNERGVKRPLLVCGKHSLKTELYQKLSSVLDMEVFTDFNPNPSMDEVKVGVGRYVSSGCDSFVSFGGGSAMDVAKCIKFELNDMNLIHVAIPTTAGTGSESTKFATVYVDGLKKSMETIHILPDAVFLDPVLIHSMPYSVRSYTFVDALCQCLESLWAVNSDRESIAYAYRGAKLLVRSWKTYLDNPSDNDFRMVQIGSNLSGKAINISKTTSAHALSYILTSDRDIPHGFAVGMCMPFVMDMYCNPGERKILTENREYILDLYMDIFDTDSVEGIIKALSEILNAYIPESGERLSDEDCIKYAGLVNVQRMSNYPVSLSEEDILEVYKGIRL